MPTACCETINNTCQLKEVYNQSSLFIYISYNIKAKFVRACVSCVCLSPPLSLFLCVLVFVYVCVAAGEEIDIHDPLADTMSLNDWVNLFTNDDNDSDFEGF